MRVLAAELFNATGTWSKGTDRCRQQELRAVCLFAFCVLNKFRDIFESGKPSIKGWPVLGIDPTGQRNW